MILYRNTWSACGPQYYLVGEPETGQVARWNPDPDGGLVWSLASKNWQEIGTFKPKGEIIPATALEILITTGTTKAELQWIEDELIRRDKAKDWLDSQRYWTLKEIRKAMQDGFNKQD